MVNRLQFYFKKCLDRRFTTICLPVECILNMKCGLYGSSIIIFISTGLKYASWLRRNLELDLKPSRSSSSFYCPLQGNEYQKKIVFAMRDVTFQTTHILENFYCNVLENIDYKRAIKILQNVVSRSVLPSVLPFLGVHEFTSCRAKRGSNANSGLIQPDECKNVLKLNHKQPQNWFYLSDQSFFKPQEKWSSRKRNLFPNDVLQTILNISFVH